MTKVKKKYFGFGMDPEESQNFFYIKMPSAAEGMVEIWECFEWRDGDFETKPSDILRLMISKARWNAVSKDLGTELNNRLKTDGKPVGKFGKEGTIVEKMLGKEMMVLLWGIENVETRQFQTALRNWLGFLPEERWWLYTMTNASTGGINDSGKGWRQALRYILCENPISPQQGALI
ncbi:MAG: DUF3780 domain-containing protein [Anaerolineaceae bacterium]|nr:DUF3780 domain-containing protein [Anaerolineaceae bacterium]